MVPADARDDSHLFLEGRFSHGSRGPHLILSGTSQGPLRDLSGTAQGPLRDRSGTAQGPLRDLSGAAQLQHFCTNAAAAGTAGCSYDRITLHRHTTTYIYATGASTRKGPGDQPFGQKLGMYAALRKLGAINTNERIQRFVSDQRHQTLQQLDHDYNCICRDCERQQRTYLSPLQAQRFRMILASHALAFSLHILVLALRRSRRSVPKTHKDASTKEFIPLLNSEEGLHSGRAALSSEQPRQTTFRRRPTNENARRGESKLGRAAHLKPGRITLPLPESIFATKAKSEAADKEMQPLLVPSAASSLAASRPGKKRENASKVEVGSCPNPSEQPEEAEDESSWDSDEHSLHSNLVHHEAKQMKKTQEGIPPSTTAKSPVRSESDQREEKDEATCPLLDDFFQRNPAAVANGWLAMPHHRDVPEWMVERDRSKAMQSVARDLIQTNQPRLLGLVPQFRSRRRSRRK